MSQSFSITNAVFQAGQSAGYRMGSSQSYRHTNSCVVSFAIIKGGRWSAALSFLCRSLQAAGIRFRVVRYFARGHFAGFAVVIRRGFYLP